MIVVCLESFLLRILMKLHSQRVSMYRVLKRVGSNTCELKIPMSLESTLFSSSRIQLLTASKPVDYLLLFSICLSWLPQVRSIFQCIYHQLADITLRRESILKDEIILTVDGGYQRYLICWSGQFK